MKTYENTAVTKLSASIKVPPTAVIVATRSPVRVPSKILQVTAAQIARIRAIGP